VGGDGYSEGLADPSPLVSTDEPFALKNRAWIMSMELASLRPYAFWDFVTKP
jgi:hypothetical protein